MKDYEGRPHRHIGKFIDIEGWATFVMVAQLIAQKLKRPAVIYAAGSRAKGRNNPNSDYDIAIKLRKYEIYTVNIDDMVKWLREQTNLKIDIIGYVGKEAIEIPYKYEKI